MTVTIAITMAVTVVLTMPFKASIVTAVLMRSNKYRTYPVPWAPALCGVWGGY